MEHSVNYLENNTKEQTPPHIRSTIQLNPFIYTHNFKVVANKLIIQLTFHGVFNIDIQSLNHILPTIDLF